MPRKYSLAQLRSAWGAGRAQAVRDGEVDPLEGKYFHSFKDGRLHWQGRVLHSMREGYYLVQLYSWLDGRPTNQQLVAYDSMLDWHFYTSHAEWVLQGAEC
jgi:hypothetical protein